MIRLLFLFWWLLGSLAARGQCDGLLIDRPKRDAFTGKSNPLTLQTPEVGGIYATQVIDPKRGPDSMRITVRIKGGGPYGQSFGVWLLLADSSRIERPHVWVVAIPETRGPGWHWQSTFALLPWEIEKIKRLGLLGTSTSYASRWLSRKEMTRLQTNLTCLLTWK